MKGLTKGRQRSSIGRHSSDALRRLEADVRKEEANTCGLADSLSFSKQSCAHN